MEEILYQVKENMLVVRLPKEFDHHSAKQVTEQTDWYLVSTPLEGIVFDFQNTEFMDSSGVGAIIGRFKRIKTKGKLIARNVSPTIERILLISGLYKIMEKDEDWSYGK